MLGLLCDALRLGCIFGRIYARFHHHDLDPRVSARFPLFTFPFSACTRSALLYALLNLARHNQRRQTSRSSRVSSYKATAIPVM
jgi:hypothetical protein